VNRGLREVNRGLREVNRSHTSSEREFLRREAWAAAWMSGARDLQRARAGLNRGSRECAREVGEIMSNPGK
jgi:hypothetical protein